MTRARRTSVCTASGVLGTTDDLSRLLRESKPDEVLIAIPSAAGDVRQQIVNVASDADIPVKTFPGIYELISGDHDLAAQIRPVQVEDVLGREPVEVDLEAVSTYVAGETVLVTGAGGSIGSSSAARSRTSAPCASSSSTTPSLGAVRDRARARGRAGLPAAIPIIGDVKNQAEDAPGLRALPAQDRLPRGRVQARPAEEANPIESVRNNVLGTKASRRSRSHSARSVSSSCRRTRRIQPAGRVWPQCKTLCRVDRGQAYGDRPDVPTRFVAVRFGNVLAPRAA